MTSKLIPLSPEETQRHLNALSDRYTAVLSFKPKENAVKQELEKAQEAYMGILKVTRELHRAFPNADYSSEHQKWKSYMEWVNKKFVTEMKALETDF